MKESKRRYVTESGNSIGFEKIKNVKYITTRDKTGKLLEKRKEKEVKGGIKAAVKNFTRKRSIQNKSEFKEISFIGINNSIKRTAVFSTQNKYIDKPHSNLCVQYVIKAILPDGSVYYGSSVNLNKTPMDVSSARNMALNNLYRNLSYEKEGYYTGKISDGQEVERTLNPELAFGWIAYESTAKR